MQKDRCHKKPGYQEREKNQGHYPQCKNRGRRMHQFQGMWMPLMEVDPGNSRIINLFEKLPQAGSPFMIDIGLPDQPGPEALLLNPDTHVHVLPETHGGESACLLKNLL